jgi:hypothetical protein
MIAGRRMHAALCEYYYDAGEWTASHYPHKTLFAAAFDGQGKSHYDGLLEGIASEITTSPGLLMTFVPRPGSPNVLHSQACIRSDRKRDPQCRESWRDGLCLGGNTTDF